jgi:mannose-6-phosphate isomerase-like protein (cupin superfamily)
MDVVNLKEKLELFSDQWSPKIIGEIDNYHVYLTKIEGDFVWHAHEGQDEFFLVVDGRFRMDFREKSVWVEAGETITVPAGTEHKPFASRECAVLVIENAETKHTGGVDDPRRKDTHDRI